MNEQRDRWIDIEALMAAGEDDGCPPARAWDDLAEIKEELERLRTEGTPGVVHKIDKVFYELAIKERDYERHVADSLRNKVERLRKDRSNILAQSDERWRQLDQALTDRVRLAKATRSLRAEIEQLRGQVVTDGLNDKLRVVEVYVPAGHEAVVRPASMREESAT